ncbi:MAG: hypothetical protein AW09_001840 [Candidatus Accumulibacter phosphatis]|uniref:Uncharacterized protein n=1 Tax=Candidatus Accumulibacter phosphatis TaxID=327160 RepID=A0A080M746_9PROT|nr:MAG: hypothetical protein AW09_001840 [Candidatus Accumulibacter phosphatis]
MHGDQRRHTATLEVLRTYRMPWTLRCNHDDVHIVTRHHLVVMHIEAVCKCQGCTFLHVRCHFRVVYLRNGLIRKQHHHHIGTPDGPGHFFHLQAGILGLAPGRTLLAQTDRHLDTGIAQILCMRMPLGSVANDGDFLALDQGEVGVLVVIYFHGISFTVLQFALIRLLEYVRHDRCRRRRYAPSRESIRHRSPG